MFQKCQNRKLLSAASPLGFTGGAQIVCPDLSCIKLVFFGFSIKHSWDTSADAKIAYFHPCNLKNEKNAHGGVLLLVKLQAIAK